MSRTYVLYFTMGLADVVAAELAEVVPNATLVQPGERFHVVELADADVEAIGRDLRTADDLRLLVAGPRDVADEASFAALCEQGGERIREALADDPRDAAPPWSITVSARRPVWREGPRWDPAPTIGRHLHGADVEGRERAPIDVRLQVDEQAMHLAMSLPRRAVGARDDAPVVRKGALRASVAAAVVRVACDGAADAVWRRGVYDAFTGSGTIAAEAARAGLPVFASDIDPEAVELCRARLQHVGLDHVAGRTRVRETDALRHVVFVHDVHDGWPSRVDARILVGNLPWGKQVKLKRGIELFEAVSAMAAVAIADGGACALLTTHAQPLIARLRKRVKADLDIAVLPLGLLGQRPAIVHGRRAGEQQRDLG